MRPRLFRRLHMRVWLTTLLSLVVVVVLCALLWGFTAERSTEAESDRFIGALVAAALPPRASPADLHAAMERLVVPPIRGIALFDSRGLRLALAGDASNLDATALARAGDHHVLISTRRAIALGDGRVVLVRVRSEALQWHVRGLAMLGLVAFAVALGTWPVARQVTRRLERLADAVDRFGKGDTGVRARLAGHDEVATLAARFDAMADRVAGLLDAHRRMLANASHELRSPLARLRVALELHAGDPRPDLLQDMRDDCAEIDGQIEEILLASKLETVDTAHPSGRVDLEALLAEECARLDVPFDSVPADVRGDARLLRRLLRNLLENALKYGVTGVDAKLSIDARGARIVQVGDRGPGIAEAERERIFEPFYRPAQSAETGTGWGLGLALARQIADHHGGTVRCLAREGGGCVFEVALAAPY